MKRILKSRKGESYIDTVVGLFVLLAVVALALNLYSFFTLKQDVDEISEQLIEVAAYNGSFSDAFNSRADQLRNQFNLDFEVSVSAYQNPNLTDTVWFNSSEKKVNHGQIMEVTVTTEGEILGLGRFVNIPVHVKSVRTGLSRHYWKEDANNVPPATEAPA